MNIKFSYRFDLPELPPVRDQLQQRWRAAKVLEAVGMPLEDWSPPPADTPENSLKNRAFSKDGPTEAVIAILKKRNGLRQMKIIEH